MEDLESNVCLIKLITFMRKNTLKFFLTLLLMVGVMPAMASEYDNVVAEWSYKNDLPTGINAATSFEGKTGEVASTVEGIVMLVDATNGKLFGRGSDAQFRSGTIIKLPVKSARDFVYVEAYPGYANFTVGGDTDSDGDNIVAHKATAAEAAAGYVEVISTGDSYLYNLKVVHVSAFQEKCLYSTDFSDWTDAKAATDAPITVEQSTKYSKETITFSLFNTAIASQGVNDKFNSGEALGWLQANKAADPYVTTTKFAQISKIRYVHAATGSNRGWKLEAKGDGDADWVVLSETVAHPSDWCEVNVDVNRTNVELRWTNLNSSQNAYMFELDIFGYVDMSKTPMLGTMSVNGKTYAAADVFAEDNEGINVGTIEISKKDKMISAENPIADMVADNGEVTSVEYATADNSTVATIVVTANGVTSTYKATFVFKPDFTVTYYAADGTTVLGTQTVEKDATIGEFAYTVEDVADGYKFRGWFVEPKEYCAKVALDEPITANTNIYAGVTDIEVSSDTERYHYPLSNVYFLDEDHEGINMYGTGKYHNNHGWIFSADDYVELLVGKKAYIIMTLCQYSKESVITVKDESGKVVGTANSPVATDGQSVTVKYEGEPGSVYVSMTGTNYIHDITVINDANNTITKNEQGYYVVKAGDADSFLSTLEIANANASDEARTYIYVPNGTYDLGTRALTKVSGNNISIIGESMDGTIIVNCPEAEGIGITATLLVTGQNTYFQDLTLKNAMDFYSASTAGRAVCLQDKGARTICKNVKMLSYQDTYYSNAANQFYWETSEIHGCVDFICGGGDVFFNKCLIVCESRKKDEKNGEATITAPFTEASNTFGYVFDGCTIENKASKFNFGRAWGGVPRLAWLNTTINQPNEVNTNRFTPGGMNVIADKFVEYNSVDTEGKVVSPASNVVNFNLNGKTNEMETILTAEQAAGYALDLVFKDWTPDVYAAQAPQVANLKFEGSVLSWDNSEEALLWAIVKNGEVIAFTTEPTYTVDDATATYGVRAANEMGGLGEVVTFGQDDSSTTNIDITNIDGTYEVVKTLYYTVQGVLVGENYKGMVIKVDYLSNGEKVTTKTIK